MECLSASRLLRVKFAFSFQSADCSAEALLSKANADELLSMSATLLSNLLFMEKICFNIEADFCFAALKDVSEWS